MMVENNNNTITKASAIFPITFFNGETELNMGTVQITPSLTFKSFQSIISQILQISPHQITIYIETNQTHYQYNPHRRRQPITSKFDFSLICNDSSSMYFFWVVRKRSRRTRRRRNRNQNHIHSHSTNNNNSNINEFGDYLEFNNEYYLGRLGFLEREKERYLMSMSLNSDIYDELSCFGGGQGYIGNFSDDCASSCGGGSSGATSSSIGFCDVCFFGGDKTVPFHCCRNDAVIKVFRSPAGPIAPPKKIDFLS